MVHVDMKSVHLLCSLWCQNICAVKLKAEMTKMLLTSAYSKHESGNVLFSRILINYMGLHGV